VIKHISFMICFDGFNKEIGSGKLSVVGSIDPVAIG
jgi:hypothetical protein